MVCKSTVIYHNSETTGIASGGRIAERNLGGRTHAKGTDHNHMLAVSHTQEHHPLITHLKGIDWAHVQGNIRSDYCHKKRV